MALRIGFFVLISTTPTRSSQGSRDVPAISTNYLASCLNAQSLENGGLFCDFATWTSALLYDNKVGNFSYFSPSTAMTAAQQNEYARSLFKELGNTDEQYSGECGLALQRLACVLAFPKCATSGSSLSSLSYYRPCRLQCEQVNTRCQSQGLRISCHTLLEKDCFLSMPSGFFALSPIQGPFSALPVFYAGCLALWLTMTTLWNYWAFVVHRDTNMLLCRVVACVPIIKCIVITFAVAFWSTCLSWQMCSFWISVTLVNTQLVFETAQIALFLLVSKGWRITREGLPQSEWRSIVVTVSAFYMCNSIITVLEGNALTTSGFWIASALLYATNYILILRSTHAQLRILEAQIALLPPGLPDALTEPPLRKLRMYHCFLGLTLICVGMENLAHALVAENGRILLVLVVYEVSNLLLLGTLGWIFRPREHSPFFYMVPARPLIEDGEPHSLPFFEIINGGCVGDGEALIELAPLIRLNDDTSSPLQMIVVTQPTDTLPSKFALGLR